MFLDSFKIAGFAVAQIFLLVVICFLLAKKQFLQDKGLEVLRWIFPLLNLLVTACGLLCGFLLVNFIKGGTQKIRLKIKTFAISVLSV